MSKEVLKKGPVRSFNSFTGGDYPKMLYSGDNYYNQATIRLTPETIEMAANELGGYDTAIVLSKFLGTMVLGPIALLTALQNIRIGPKSSLNPMLETYIPSTTYTPVPTLWPMKQLDLSCVPLLNEISSSIYPDSPVEEESGIGDDSTMSSSAAPAGSDASSPSSAASAASEPTAPAAAQTPPITSGKYIWPLAKCFPLSAPFGEVRGSRTHKGIDIAKRGEIEGTPVISVADGTVTQSKLSSTAGNWVVVKHAEGVESEYMHMRERNVSIGQTVKQGDQLGTVGNTGRSTGFHLHFGMKVNGSYVDPMSMVAKCSGYKA